MKRENIKIKVNKVEPKTFIKIPSRDTGIFELPSHLFKFLSYLYSHNNGYTFTRFFMTEGLGGIDYRMIEKNLIELEKRGFLKWTKENGIILIKCNISTHTNSTHTNSTHTNSTHPYEVGSINTDSMHPNNISTHPNTISTHPKSISTHPYEVDNKEDHKEEKKRRSNKEEKNFSENFDLGLDLEKEEKIKNDTYPNIDNENYGLNNKEEKIKNNTYPSIENSSYEFTNFYLSEKFEGVYEDMLIELYNKNKPNMSIENYENLIYQFFNGDVEKYNYVQLSTLIDEKNNIIINQ